MEGQIRSGLKTGTVNKYVANLEVGGDREQAQTFEAGRSVGD
jgi:hypothetical protein